MSDSRNIRKQTFFTLGSTGATETDINHFVSEITGLDPEVLRVLSTGQRKLTVEEYEVMQRCPADLLPDAIVQQRRNRVLSLFEGECTPEITGAEWEALKKSNWELVEEDTILSKAANIMTPFIRIRPRRLLQAISLSNLWDKDLEHVAKLCYNEHFNKLRYCATLILMLVGTKLQRNELLYMLEHGGAYMDSTTWIKATKEHHAFVKNTHRFLLEERQLHKSEVSQLLYFQALTCRDYYITDADTEKGVRERTAPVYNYKMGTGTDSDFKNFSVNRWRELMVRTGLVKGTCIWEDFLNALYLKLPSGSCRLSKKVNFKQIATIAGVGDGFKGDLRGNKRLEGEMTRLGHFNTFKEWNVHAFLKYEVYKNRWLYPAGYNYVVLGLYVMDHLENAFHAVSGVDMGHDLCGSIATKLDVWYRVSTGNACFNTDGANFNREHSQADMKIVYDVCRTTVNGSKSTAPAIQELNAASIKYHSSLRNRVVNIPKMKGLKNSRRFSVSDTLFSGESTTMFLNTMLLGCLAMGAAEALRELKGIPWLLLFWKGDDLNGFTYNWIAAYAVLRMLERMGMVLEPSKDHVEYKFSEHERCIVTLNGYGGSLLRRIGSLVAAEPQGAQATPLEEALLAFNEARMSLICRGAEMHRARAVFNAMVMTYLDEDKVPAELSKLFNLQKCNGGFGLWSQKQFYSTYHTDPPRVETRVRLLPRGKLSKLGTAFMTDNLLRVICNKHGYDVRRVNDIREEMVADAALVGLGPEKFGGHRKSNIRRILDRGKSIKVSRMHIGKFKGPVNELAHHIINDLKQLMAEPHELRHCGIMSPSGYLKETLAATGCLNVKLYMRLHGYTDKTAAYRGLTSVVKNKLGAKVMERLWKRGADVAMYFLEDKVHCVFWEEHTRINVEIAALVRRFTLYWIARSEQKLDINAMREINLLVSLEALAVSVARKVWMSTKHILGKVVY
jgi:hypothetical protein